MSRVWRALPHLPGLRLECCGHETSTHRPTNGRIFMTDQASRLNAPNARGTAANTWRRGTSELPQTVSLVGFLDDLDRLDVVAGRTDGVRNASQRTQHVGQIDSVPSAATVGSASSQLDLITSSHLSWRGHHSVDAETDLGLAQTLSCKLRQHRGITLRSHWIKIDQGAPRRDHPDPHIGRFAARARPKSPAPAGWSRRCRQGTNPGTSMVRERHHNGGVDGLQPLFELPARTYGARKAAPTKNPHTRHRVHPQNMLRSCWFLRTVAILGPFLHVGPDPMA